jgi:hypothetical protein
MPNSVRPEPVEELHFSSAGLPEEVQGVDQLSPNGGGI